MGRSCKDVDYIHGKRIGITSICSLPKWRKGL